MKSRKIDLSRVPREVLEGLLTKQSLLLDTIISKKPVSYKFLPDDNVKAVMSGEHGGNRLPTNMFSAEKSHLDGEGVLHRLFIGDNFHTLAGLNISEAESFDLIYIDPPYNTGRDDMVYNDRFLTEADGWMHSKWESFIDVRLRLAKPLLKTDGVIIVAIGHNEVARLRLIMDEVFGESNFIDQVVWSAGAKGDARFISGSTDHMLVYARSLPALSAKGPWRKMDDKWEEYFHAAARVWGDTSSETDVEARKELSRKKFLAVARREFKSASASLRSFNRFDERGRLYSSDGGNVSFPGGGGYTYDVIHPVTGEVVTPPPGGYRYVETTMRRMIAEGLIEFGADHTTQLKKRRFEYTGTVLRNVISQERSRANRHLKSILGPSVFQYPKDHLILAEWFDVIAPRDAKILDFFGGSGSTAEAVLHLNKLDGGTRSVTLATDDFHDIGTTITRERVVRVMTGEGWHDGKSHNGYGGRLAVSYVGTQAAVGAWSLYSHNTWTRNAGRWALSRLPIDVVDDGAHLVVSDGDTTAVVGYGVPKDGDGAWVNEDVVESLAEEHSAEHVYVAHTVATEYSKGLPLAELTHSEVSELPAPQLLRVRRAVDGAVHPARRYGSLSFIALEKIAKQYLDASDDNDE